MYGRKKQMEQIKIKNTEIETGKTTALLKALLVSYLITGALLLFLALLLYKFQLEEKVVSIGILIIYAISCGCGGILVGKLCKKRKFVWGLLNGCIYFLILLVVSIILEEDSEVIATNICTTFLICASSGMLGGMII